MYYMYTATVNPLAQRSQAARTRSLPPRKRAAGHRILHVRALYPCCRLEEKRGRSVVGWGAAGVAGSVDPPVYERSLCVWAKAEP